MLARMLPTPSVTTVKRGVGAGSFVLMSHPLSVIPGQCEASNPESRDSPMRNCASEVWSFGPSRNDEAPVLPIQIFKQPPRLPRLHDLAACARVLPPTSRPKKIKGRRECRALGAPAALCAKVKKHTSIVTTVTPETPGIPRAMVLTAYTALSPVSRALLPPSLTGHHLPT